MMYQFRDVNESPSVRELPSEAMKINGLYLEDEIPGYRTLYVKGRESLAPQLEMMEVGTRDGSRTKSRRYPARPITVGYQLITNSPEEFRERYNKLGAFVEQEDAELIFNDEQDKFFLGSICELGEVEPGRLAIKSEFKIICQDPFKYSVEEYEATTSAEEPDVIQVDYHGTYSAFPRFEAEFYKEDESDGENDTPLTGTGDCGYVSFFNEDERIIQLGNPDEEEGEDLPPSQTLTSQSFSKASYWGTATKRNWPANVGITSGASVVQTGSLGVSASLAGSSTTYLKAASYGTGAKYHGPSAVRTLPADKAGQTGAKDFTFTYRQKFAIGNTSASTKQIGLFQAHVLYEENGEKKRLASVQIYKDRVGKSALIRMLINGVTVYSRTVDVSYYNKYFGNNRSANRKKKIKASTAVRTTTIIKSGNTISFSVGGIKKTFAVEDDVANLIAKQIEFYFGAHSTRPKMGFNGVFSAKFTKNNCATWKDVPNKFGANDVLTADCRTGTIELNDTPSPELGAVGNDWEEFKLVPGINRIGCAYSDFTPPETAPVLKVKYREVFL